MLFPWHLVLHRQLDTEIETRVGIEVRSGGIHKHDAGKCFLQYFIDSIGGVAAKSSCTL